MVAYLATNIFDHLYARVGCTAADIAALRKGVYSRALKIPLGIHNIEEIIARRRAPQALTAQLRLLLSVSNWRSLLKPCDVLLTDDLRSFASNGEPAGPFLRGEMQNAISAGIAELLESDGEEIGEDLARVLEEVKAGKRAFAAVIRESMDSAVPRPAGGGFEEYLRLAAPSVAQRLAEQAGVAAECKRRGLDNLLGIRSVRMITGAALSFAYAQSFEGRAPQPDDAGETLHAVTAAAAADTFVSDDARLVPLLARGAADGLQVADLQGFLAQAVPSQS